MRRLCGVGVLACLAMMVAGAAEAADVASLSILSVSTSTPQPGERVDFSVTVRNTGTTTWSPIGSTFSPNPSASGGITYPQQSGYYYLQLGYYYLDAANPFDDRAFLQSLIPMPAVLAPGQSATINSYFYAPSAVGRWGFTVEMAKVFVHAFEDHILNSAQDHWNSCPRYEFQVASCTAPGSFSLSAPATGQVLPAGTSQATLQWSSASGASSYDVYFGSSSSPGLLASQAGTSRNVSVSEGQTYYWRVVARNSCGTTSSSSGTRSFSVAKAPEPAADPGMTSTLRLVSGALAGQTVSPSSRTVTVAPGASIVGQINVEIKSTYGAGSVMAMAVTPSWGSHESSFVDLGGFATPVAGLVRTVPVTLTAPTTPGSYNVIIAFRAEYTAAQLMSCTNWAVGAPEWNDGNDVSDWTAATIASANASGTVSVPYKVSGGGSIYVPATAITVVVPGAASGGPVLSLQRGAVEVSVTYRNQYSGATGSGRAIPQRDEFGFFYFSDASNPEVFVKVLDWGASSPYLLFYSGLTDFEYTVTFRNVAKGISLSFTKPAGGLCGGLNTTDLPH